MRISDWSSDVCSSDLRALPGELDDRALGDRVGRLIGCAYESRDRAEVDDRSLRLGERLDGGLREDERPHDVDGEEALHIGDRGFGEGLAQEDAGVVDDDVQPPDALLRETDCLARGPLEGDVGGDRKSTRLNSSY